MGNAPGKMGPAMEFDGGSLVPNGIYAEDAQDFDAKVVQRLIVGRRLAPFYAGADEPDPGGADGDCRAGKPGPADDGWWSYNLVVAQQQQQEQLEETADETETEADEAGARAHRGHARKGSGLLQRLRTTHAAEAAAAGSGDECQACVRHERSASDMAVGSDGRQAEMRRRHIECPICFLYYPSNINYTRCCHKPICTECFVQIKRKLEDDAIVPTHCPYCVEANLGIVYHAPAQLICRRPAPPARAPTAPPRTLASSPRLVADGGVRARSQSACPAAPAAADPPIVMSDDIRPGLVRALAARLDARHKRQLRSAETMALVAAATRRASALESERVARAPRRPSLTRDTREYARYLMATRAANHSELEEFMFQEAVRASLAEQQQPQPQEPQQQPQEPQEHVGSAVGSDASLPASSPRNSTAEHATSTVASSTDVAVDVDTELSRELDAAARIDGSPPLSPGQPFPAAAEPEEQAQPAPTCAGLVAGGDRPHMSPPGDPLTLAAFELDAIASVGGPRRRRPAPPMPRTAPSYPVSPPEPDDLMRFDDLPPAEPRSPSLSPPSAQRLRRRPAPPPPPGAGRGRSESTMGAAAQPAAPADKTADGAPPTQALFL
ncbi:SNF1-interacting protein [Coemansia helicoidea]|uniref:SNF1-interacting protein n=4 Tax=Coemansia TaxID=4863 RepID=A0ACC1L530_9FUNG|nr:SNF1-interacting protein [Coemansia helicoidea]